MKRANIPPPSHRPISWLSHAYLNFGLNGQTNISIKAVDDAIYCIPKSEIDRIYYEYSPKDNLDEKMDGQDISVRYLKSVNINEPIYFVDQVGLNFYVDDVTGPINIIYYKCTDLIDPLRDDKSTKLNIDIKAR